MEKVIDADACNYNAIDLGLSSGLKWADRNVGAESPEAYGYYLAWGETAPRGENWATEAPYDWGHVPFNDGETAFSETYFNSAKDAVCPGGVLASDYDAAHAIMGGSWRMPTSAEMRELFDGTTQTRETLNGVYGMRFTAPNGNSIFMPFAGRRYGSDVDGVGYRGYLWSSSLRAGGADYSNYLSFYGSGNAYVNSYSRFYGFVARGVYE